MSDEELIELANECAPIGDWPGRDLVDLDSMGDPGFWIQEFELEDQIVFERSDEKHLCEFMAEDYLAKCKSFGYPTPIEYLDHEPTETDYEEERAAYTQEFEAMLREWRRLFKEALKKREDQTLVRDFAEHTRHNLELLRQRQIEGDEVYEVTQLINSMLGLLVLPLQQYMDSIPEIPLSELQEKGWPAPVLEGEFKAPKHLRDLMRLLRNSVAHFNIEFTETDGAIDGVILSNKCNCGNTIWQATLSLADLETLTERFIELILKQEVPV